MKNLFLTKIQNYIIFLLLSLLPISNVIVYYSTNVLNISPLVTLWKEFLLSVLLITLLFTFNSTRKNIALIFSAIVLILLGLISSFTNQIPINQIIIGFRFELLWIILLVLVTVSKPIEIKTFEFGILVGFAFVVLLALLGFVIGEQQLYTALGFQNGWGSSGIQTIGSAQIFNTPFCHTTNGGITDCRLTAGFSSANNLAGYLLMVFFYFIYQFKELTRLKYLYLSLSFVCLILLFFTYSRFAIVAILIGLVIIGIYYSKIFNIKLKQLLVFLTLLLPLFSVVFFQAIYDNKSIKSKLPSFLVKDGSSNDHFKLTTIATDVIKRDGAKILINGYGLSQTGPGAKSEYIDFNTSKFVNRNKDIAAKVGIPEYNMSVPENWFLQIILNGGWLYATIYFIIIGISIRGLLGNNYATQILLLSLLCIIIGNLYLHLWESVTLNIYYSLFLLYYYFKVDKLTKLEHI
jgi:O-Antigen ligase